MAMSTSSAMNRVARRLSAPTETGCVLWLGGKDRHGYGWFWPEGKQRPKVSVHRWMYQVFVGPIGPRLCVLHECDTPACVSPSHLRLGTHRENSRDMVMRGRSPRGERHGRVKLTERQVLEIRSRGQMDTTSRAALAREFGVTKDNIAAILSRRSWRFM
jgi:hypothetical protein